MLWVVVLIAVVHAAGAAICCGLAMARIVYGYPLGRRLMQRKIRRRDEHRFLPGDVRELDEAFLRVIRAYSAD